MIHIATTAALFSGNKELQESAIEQIQLVDNWDYNISWVNLSTIITPAKTLSNVKIGFSKLSRIISRSAQLKAKGVSASWKKTDLGSTMENLIGKDIKKITFEMTETGKVIWSNAETGYKIIHDPINKYFRIQNKDGHYVGLNGQQIKIPNELTGSAARKYFEENTHFSYD